LQKEQEKEDLKLQQGAPNRKPQKDKRREKNRPIRIKAEIKDLEGFAPAGSKGPKKERKKIVTKILHIR